MRKQVARNQAWDQTRTQSNHAYKQNPTSTNVNKATKRANQVKQLAQHNNQRKHLLT